MTGRARAVPVRLTVKRRRKLEQILAAGTSPQRLVLRARIVLAAASGAANAAIAAPVASPEASREGLHHIANNSTNDRPGLGLAFSLQPSIFGFSIDFIKAGSYLSDLLQDHHRPVGCEFSTPAD